MPLTSKDSRLSKSDIQNIRYLGEQGGFIPPGAELSYPNNDGRAHRSKWTTDDGKEHEDYHITIVWRYNGILVWFAERSA
ncbi:hypothetical protein ABEF95_005316 [Exophiala dermatitidis]